MFTFILNYANEEFPTSHCKITIKQTPLSYIFQQFQVVLAKKVR